MAAVRACWRAGGRRRWCPGCGDVARGSRARTAGPAHCAWLSDSQRHPLALHAARFGRRGRIPAVLERYGGHTSGMRCASEWPRQHRDSRHHRFSIPPDMFAGNGQQGREPWPLCIHSQGAAVLHRTHDNQRPGGRKLLAAAGRMSTARRRLCHWRGSRLGTPRVVGVPCRLWQRGRTTDADAGCGRHSSTLGKVWEVLPDILFGGGRQHRRRCDF
mmetsp:Transcript_72911/g.144482  ORF Transcript_72911/g.144482 Transcript_72911/m.144482 type:complete len:216 (+) Transcript_72911:100-747(+)